MIKSTLRLVLVALYCIVIPWAVIMGITAGLQSGITVGRWCNESRIERDIVLPIMPMEGLR